MADYHNDCQAAIGATFRNGVRITVMYPFRCSE